jgi:exodeoxyribonuclease III
MLKPFIETEDPDILCLSEIKITDDLLASSKLNKLFSDKYLSFWNCSKGKKGYSGVAIFTKFRPIKVIYGLPESKFNIEGRLLALEFEFFFLINVYVPHIGPKNIKLKERLQWDKELQKFIKELKDTNKNVILCGDLNVAHFDIDVKYPQFKNGKACCTKEERDSFSRFLDLGYIDSFRNLYPKQVKHSHFSKSWSKDKREGWQRIDYFIINENGKKNLVDSGILEHYMGSDHVPIKLVWKN